MINEQAVLSCIEQTMIADAKTIKDAELQLFEFQKEEGFTSFLLKVVANAESPINIRLSSVIYLKNKVNRSWRSDQNKDELRNDDLHEAEENILKENIIQVLVNNCNDNHLRPHLTESIKIILTRTNNWDLTHIILELLNSGKQEYVYAGLLLVFEMCNAHRYDIIDNRQQIDKFIGDIFPVMENILSQLINQDDYKSSELLYLILKSFKYGCLNNFPQYFNNVEKLNSWIQLHLFICAKPLPKEVLELDFGDRSLDKRVKVNKWGFGNLNRFIHRYSKETKSISAEFIKYLFDNIIPQILQEFFKIMESWGNNNMWLSDSSLYHLIQFLEKCTVSDSLYPLIETHLGAIIENILFKCVCASQQSIELLEDDPEEYTRRYFDVNKEGSTADVASTDFIFVIGHKRPEKLQMMIPFVNNVLNTFIDNSDNLEIACKQEGAMRIMSSLFSFFYDDTTSVEGIFTHYIANLISQTKYPFLVARGLETVANFSAKFKDMNTLSKLYELAYNSLLNSDVLPIQIEAADALKTLIVSNPDIHSHISPQVPGIMERLIRLSKDFEIDIISEIMESFVERFADELTPFAKDLATNVAEQFISLSRSMIENSSSAYSTGDQDQEIQASSLLQTMTTMVMSMNKVALFDQFIPVCKFVINNAQIVLITEIVDLMDALALSSKTLYQQFTPEIWDLFHDVMDSFQTYAMDYFECYNVFFETVVLFGFPKDQTFLTIFLQILQVKLQSDIDFDVESVFNLLQLFALSMNDTPMFQEILSIGIKNEADFDEKSFIKCYLSYIYVKPIESLTIMEQNNVTLDIFKLWFDYKFCSVYGIKLQIMAIISMFNLPELPNNLINSMSQFGDKLVTLVESLPKAIKRRDNMTDGEELVSSEPLDPEDEDEYYEDFEDDFKETPLENINAFEEIFKFFHNLQTTNVTRYEQIISSLSDEKKSSLQTILEFVGQKK